MSSLFQYILETTLILGVFVLFFEFILKSEKSFQYNRYFLLAAPFLALVLPLLEIPFILGLPSKESLSFVYELPTIVTGVTTFIEPAPQFSIPGWLLFIYFAGAFVFVIRLLVQFSQLNDIITFAKKRIPVGDYTLVISRNPVPTFAFLHYIVIGSDKSFDESTIVHSLNHEKVHIRQRHTIDILIIELLTIVFWFNPILYYYKRIIRENHEFLADHQASKDEPLAYSLALLKEMQKGACHSIPNYFSMQFTKKRLRMISNKSSAFGLLKPMVTLPLVLLVFIAFSCKNELLESNLEPMNKVDADFYSYAPPEFARIMTNLKNESPEKFIFFKVIKDIDLEIVKARNEEMMVEYYSEVSYNEDRTYAIEGKDYSFDWTTEGIGMIFSRIRKSNKKNTYAYDENTYTRYEASVLPEPWLGEEHLDKLISSNTSIPDVPNAEEINGTVWVRFTVNPYGNVINSRPLNHNLNTSDVNISNQFYGRALEAIRKLDGYYKPGELRGNKVNVEMVLPITF